jgi:hypothetical protein
MIAVTEGKSFGCPNCGYAGTGWFWLEAANGDICPNCHKVISRDDGTIMEQPSAEFGEFKEHRVEATIFYKKGRGWMVSIRHPEATTSAGPFMSKESAITEAKKDNPDEITVIDRQH